MKKASGIFLGAVLVCFVFLTKANAQFIQDNHFQLPVVGNEVVFVQLDTAANVLQEDFSSISKSWLAQTFGVQKYVADDPDAGHLQATVHFKIDDQQIPEPLHYTALATIDYKDQVIRLTLHQLTYETGAGKGRKMVVVTDRVKDQVRSKADQVYPHIWDSLNEYGQRLLSNFNLYVTTAASQQL